MALKSTREAAMLAIQEPAREDDKIVIVSPDAVAAARAPSSARNSRIALLRSVLPNRTPSTSRPVSLPPE